MKGFLRKVFGVKDRYYLILLLLLGIAMYSFTLRGVTGNPLGKDIRNLNQASKPFESSSERDRYVLIQSLSEKKSFALSSDLAADVDYTDLGYINGKTYILFAPGISLFALPLYELGKMYNLSQVAVYSLNALFATFTMLFLFKIGRNVLKLPVWASLLSPLTFAFASTAWSYAVTLFQHQGSTFFITSGFYAVWKYRQQEKFSWLWAVFAWAGYALAMVTDYPNAFLMLPVMIYFFLSAWKIKRESTQAVISFKLSLLFTSVLFILVTALHGYYNYTNYGNPLKVSGSLTGYREIQEQKLFDKKNAQDKIKQISAKKAPVAFFKEENFINGAETLLFSADRGILFYSPIFILAILGIFYRLRTLNTELVVLLGVIGANLFLYSSWGDPWGGYAYGPRYIIPAMAMLSLFIPLWLTNVKHKTNAKIVAFFFFMYSVAIALLGALTTNTLPPKVEALFYHLPYDYIANVQYILTNKSSSFLYNTVFSNKLSLMDYYFILFEIITLIIYVVLFIIPKYTDHEN